MPLYMLDPKDGSGDGKLIQTEDMSIDVEEHLENWLENSPMVLFEDQAVLWIGRQSSLPAEGTTIFPNLLGLDSRGDLVVVEIKTGRTPRDVLAQGLEYAAWASGLDYQALERLATEYWEGKGEGRKTLEDAFREVFLAEDPSEVLPHFNQRQALFFIAEKIDPRVARVARYLREHGKLDVRCLAFDAYRAASGEIVVSVDTVVGDETIEAPTDTPGDRWSGDSTASEVIHEAAQALLAQPGQETFSPSEVYREILKSDSSFNRGTNNAQITAGCVNCRSRRHYPGRKPNHFFRVGRGLYRLYDAKRDGTWDQEGNPLQAVGGAEAN